MFATRLSPQRAAMPEFDTTAPGCRLATSVGAVLTGRGADLIVIDDPLKPEEALSQAQHRADLRERCATSARVATFRWNILCNQLPIIPEGSANRFFGYAPLAHGGTGGDSGRRRWINSAVSIC